MKTAADLLTEVRAEMIRRSAPGEDPVRKEGQP